MSTATNTIRRCLASSVTCPVSISGLNTVSIMFAVMREVPSTITASTTVEHSAAMYRFRQPSRFFQTHLS